MRTARSTIRASPATPPTVEPAITPGLALLLCLLLEDVMELVELVELVELIKLVGDVFVDDCDLKEVVDEEGDEEAVVGVLVEGVGLDIELLFVGDGSSTQPYWQPFLRRQLYS
jgi:hypothetical protein